MVLWNSARRRLALILGLALCGAVASYIAAEFLMTRYYQATALIRPVPSQSSPMIGGILGGAAGSVSSLGAVGVLGGLVGRLDSQDDKAQEYISILNSYQFTMALLKRYRLENHFVDDGGYLGSLWESPPTPWQTYKLALARFDCRYDRFTGNLTLSFIDPDQKQAVLIAGYYIESLRTRLRSEEVQGASSAIASLKEALQSTSDGMLQAQLYELMAVQVQRQKLAELEAEFDFKVIEPPVSPDRPFKPRALFDAAAGGFVAMTLALLAVLAFDSRRAVRRTRA